jgi:stress-induced-phosphoprotein 1
MEEDEDDEEVKARKEAEAEKKLGGEAYKKRDFEAAAAHYSKAWDAWPKDITFLTNLGGRRIHLATLQAVLTVDLCSRLL